MRTKTSSWLAAGLMMAALLISPAFAGTMAMGGTGGVTEPLRVIGQRFSALSGGGVVDVVPGLGSGGAISAAADGVLQVAVSGRPLTAVEAARGLTVTSVVCTPYVLATSRPEPASLDRGAIAALYAQTAPRWADGQPVRIVLRPRGESDNDVLFRSFPGVEQAVQQARQRDSVPVAATDQENADMAEQIPGSLVGTTYAQMITERRSLRMMAINGVPPDLDAYQSNRYPIGKPLYIIIKRDQAPEVTRFLDFLRSADGLAVMRQVGLVPCPSVH